MISRKVRSCQATLDLGRQRAAVRASGQARAAYIGAHGGGNLGDDAMFEAVHRVLPGYHLFSLAPLWIEKRLARVGLAGPGYFDSVILGGGTLINPSWSERVRNALALGLPVWSLGTGVGSCGFEQPGRVPLEEWAALLPAFRRIGVRGPRSLAALRRIGVRDAEIVGDLALVLTQQAPSPAASPPRVALNLSLPAGMQFGQPPYSRLRDLEPVLAGLLREGWEIVPFAVHASDVAPIRDLLSTVLPEAPRAPVISSADDLFRRIGACTFTIAVRLHAAVLSCCVGVPPLLLGYRDKCLDFMASMDLAEWHINLETAADEEIASRCAALAEEALSLRAPILDRAQGWRQRIHQYVDSTLSSRTPSQCR